MHGLERDPDLEGIVNVEETVPARVAEAFEDLGLVRHSFSIRAQTISFYFERLTRLLQCLLETAAYAHGLAHRFHLQAEVTVRSFELIEIPARHFHDHIVDGGFEKRGGGFCDLVFDLIEAITYGELCRDLCDGISCSF